MNNEATELRKMTDDQLIKEKKKLRIGLLRAHPKSMLGEKIVQTRGSTRRRMARINTILGERNRRGVAKEEVRLK